MTIQSLRRRLTVDDYHKMIDVGIFQEDDRVELLDGEIEVWIVNIKRRVIEQYTQPDGDEYGNQKIVRRGVITSNCVSSDLELSIDQVFGPQQL